jgi:hypothetical protein
MKIINKHGWLLRDFVIVGIVFGILISLYISAVGSIAQNYPASDIVNPSFSAHYNNIQSSLGRLDNSLKAVQGKGGLNPIGTFNVIFNSAYTVISLIFNGIFMYTDIGKNMVSDFPFLDGPTLTGFFLGIVAIITAVIMFIWLSSIMRGKI